MTITGMQADLRFARDWLPSRRSVESQIGALMCCLFGHVRSVNGKGLNGRYRCEGSALDSHSA
jgi:hypothetical protein